MSPEINQNDFRGFLSGKVLDVAQNHILIACFPKSGSTYFSELLVHCGVGRRATLTYGYDRREQELSPLNLLMNQGKSYVAQHHVRYSKPTAKLINIFSIQSIVLVRNIFDVVYSLNDHLDLCSPNIPLCYVDQNVLRMKQEDKLEFLVDMAIPWYFNFYVSWFFSERSTKLITYEEIISCTKGTLDEVLQSIGCNHLLPVVDVSIEAVQKINSRKNVGITGRGNELPSRLKDRIYNYANYYPGVDFSPIGID